MRPQFHFDDRATVAIWHRDRVALSRRDLPAALALERRL
jgi:hypothetical protein